MIATTHITYLLDPLCGWCYGASGVVRDLAALQDVVVELAPTGLFSGSHARIMDGQFAAYAWSNDQRIARLTGQHFSDDYREKVLGKRGSLLDSGPATVALTAVALMSPSFELDALRLIQEARYMAGRDVTDLGVLSDVLEGAGLGAAASRLAAPDDELLTQNRQRTEAARSTMQSFRVDGVPVLIVGDPQSRRLIRANELFANPGILNSLTGAKRHAPPPNLDSYKQGILQ